jgi:tetratricopeptide (TPR) repeat protein
LPAVAEMVRQAERLARSGSWDKCVALLREAEKQAPREHRLLLRHASLLERQSPDQAVRACRQALELAPRSPGAHAIAARVALTSGDPAEATRHSDGALALDRESGMARTVRALASMELGRWDEGLASLLTDGVFEEWSIVARAVLLLTRRWRELGPVRPPLSTHAPVVGPDSATAALREGGRASGRALYRHVREAYVRGDGEAMLVWLMPLRSVTPDDTDIPAAYATAYHLCGRDDLAEPWSEAALRSQAAEARADRKRAAKAAKRAKGAASAPAAVEEDASPEAVALASAVALELGDFSRARKLAEVASRRINPFDRWEVRLTLAEVLDRQTKTDAALAELTLAVAEEPSVLPLALHRIAAYPFLTAARAVLSDSSVDAGSDLARELRRAMCSVIAVPRRPRGDRALARELAKAGTLAPEHGQVLRAFAESGIRPGGPEPGR